MADPVYSLKNTAFAATTGAKTALNGIAGANTGLSLIEFGCSMDGVTSSAVPATLDLCQSTQATAGTAGGSPPAVVQTTGRAATAQITLSHNFTAEPTALTAIESFYVPQFMGLFVKQYPLGQEPETDFSGGTIRALALRINVSANVNVLVEMRVVQL